MRAIVGIDGLGSHDAPPGPSRQRRRSRRPLAVALLPLLAGLLLPAPLAARTDPPRPASPPGAAPGSKALSGGFVHNVGELQINVTNWGLLGSFPGAGWDMSDAPSAQWPAASGVEHLFCAGLWVGGRVNGVPHVSTSYYEYEFFPGDREVDTVMQSFEGDRHGNRLPSPFSDDDGDGRSDEDPLNGLDDDGDGRVDEDFAAVGAQMFRCEYRDDHPQILADSPDHEPLHVRVVQETFQWENDRVDDCVGISYTVFNEGQNALPGTYLGFAADPDIGSRTTSLNFKDDRVDFVSRDVCVWKGWYNEMAMLRLAVAYDDDGDETKAVPAPGQLGILLLDHTTDALVEDAPYFATIRSWRAFSGLLPFVEGGDAVNDEQRYELLSGFGHAQPTDESRDWRMLLSFGPFLIMPGDSVELRLALVVGEGRAGLLDNALAAQRAFEGFWFDADDDPDTGSDCNETPIFDPVWSKEWQDPCDALADPIVIPKGETLWVNADCMIENYVNYACSNVIPWCTGTDGKELQLNWMTDSAPPPPSLRVWPAQGGNVLFWDDFSETVPDLLDGDYDFEGYRIWRADNWHRPAGTSEANGPSASSWMLIAEYDAQNGLGNDTGFAAVRYQPQVDANLVAWYQQALMEHPDIEGPLDHLPPHGHALADADTAIALAKAALGIPGGKRYYSYRDTNVRAGLPYFYNVTARDHDPVFDDEGHLVRYDAGQSGGPSVGFVFTVPQTASQTAWDFDPDEVYVVPNPATPATMAPWSLQPNNDDPTGLKVEFRHLPAARCVVRIYTLAGDLVQTLVHDNRDAIAEGDLGATGTLAWNLVSRKGQDIASGVYLFTVAADGFPRKTGKFTVIR